MTVVKIFVKNKNVFIYIINNSLSIYQPLKSEIINKEIL